MHDDLMEELSQTPARMQVIVANLPAEAWTRMAPAGEGEASWSLAHLARHLRDIERDAFQFRIEQILTGGDPHFERRFSGYLAPGDESDGPTALAEFGRARGETVTRLQGLSEEEWKLAAEHPRRGPLDIAYFARAFLDHDREHLEQAQQLVSLASEQP